MRCEDDLLMLRFRELKSETFHDLFVFLLIFEYVGCEGTLIDMRLTHRRILRILLF